MQRLLYLCTTDWVIRYLVTDKRAGQIDASYITRSGSLNA